MTSDHQAGEGNRTLVACLEGRCSTIELHPHIAQTHDLHLVKPDFPVHLPTYPPLRSRHRTCVRQVGQKWGVEDSNLRRPKPTDLQSVPVDRLGNSPLSLADCPIAASVSFAAQLPSDERTVSADTSASFETQSHDRASEGTRTLNLLITNQLLCQLSYAGLPATAPRRGENQLI